MLIVLFREACCDYGTDSLGDYCVDRLRLRVSLGGRDGYECCLQLLCGIRRIQIYICWRIMGLVDHKVS